MTAQNIVLLITALLTALIAGLFYSYSCSVNPGLGKLADKEYLLAMQSINREILNPVFFASFMGTLIMLPVVTWMQYNREGATVVFWLMLASTAIYAIGTFGITAAGNVPLNEMLARFDLGNATSSQLADYRAQFEKPWNSLHAMRTVAVVISLLLLLGACIIRPARVAANTL